MMGFLYFWSLYAGLAVVLVLGDQNMKSCVTREEFEKQSQELNILSKRVIEFENIVANQDKKIKIYEERLFGLEEQVRRHHFSNNSDSLNSSSVLKRDHGNGEKRNIGNSTTQIAFFAESSDLKDLGKDQIIIFNEVRTNIGNLYNARTGVFYCDVAGVYVFFTTIVSEANHSVWTYLDKDGSRIFGIVSPHIESDFGTSSNMAVIHLERGDSVMVKSHAVYTGAAIDTWSTFSGFLLYPIL